MIRINSDYSDMYAELDRIGSMPTPGMVANLDGVLKLGFESTRAVVHVDTGRLKASGKSKSKVSKGDWQGQFSFPAVNNEEVTYGIYERKRGGAHDFFAGVFALKPLFKAAILKGLRRR
jgi:hypothetical protein